MKIGGKIILIIININKTSLIFNNGSLTIIFNKKSKWFYIYFFEKIFQFFRNSNTNWKIERLGVIFLKSPRVRTLKTINLSVYFFGQGINLIWEIQFHEFFEKLNFLRNICGYSISRIFWKIEFFEEDICGYSISRIFVSWFLDQNWWFFNFVLANLFWWVFFGFT